MGCGNSAEKRKKDFSDLLYKKKNEEQFTYKVVLLGDVFVGKTTIIKNLQENQQEIENDQYEPTIGLAFTQKSIILENKKTVNLQLWDTSGQEIYRDLMSVYYRDSHAAILVFDHTNKQSLIGLKYWLKELNDRIDTDNIIIKIIGNKFDLYDSVEDKISHQDILDCFKEFEIDKFEIINTSAIDGGGIYQLFKKIGEECYKKYSNSIKIDS